MLLFVISACGSNETQPPPREHDLGSAMARAGSMAGAGAANSGGLAGGGGTASNSAGTAGSGTSTGSGGAAAGGDAGGAPAAGSANGGSVSCESPAGAGSVEQTCVASARDDCERCLCTDCTGALQRCGETNGCPEILSCIREQGCGGVDCYCGTFDAIACAAGQANGPCKAAILQAPGAKAPTLLNPSAGPASDAALAIADCAEPGRPCAGKCPMSP